MRFTLRSLGGKLIISAAVTLLLCMLLFSAASWYLLKSFYEHAARNDANIHLASLKKAYQAQTTTLIRALTRTASSPDLRATVSQPLTPSSRGHLQGFLASTSGMYHLSGVAIISSEQHVLEQSGAIAPHSLTPLLNLALQGKAASALEMTPAGSDSTFPASAPPWDIALAVPVDNAAGRQIGVLVGTEHIDDDFVLNLIQNTGNTGLNVVLCLEQHVLIMTMRGSSFNRHLSEDALCKARVVNLVDGAQHYLTMSDLVQAQDQLPGSPSLVIVDIEPLYSINAHTERAIEILIDMGVFIIALGVIAYTLIARIFFIRPLRRLQARVAALVANTADVQDSAATIDELSMLARSFNLLSESLSTQENESHVITSQMSDLLAMSDILISTLNLEDLLREIVSRLGLIMHAKSVSLLLYGREMLSPWAVAQWTNQQQSNGYAVPSSHNGAVTVHTDPSGDITLAATTKLAAIPPSSSRSTSSSSSGSGKRQAIRAAKLTPPPEPYGFRRPRIPRPALRDLDMILARMAMQKQKIAYGEDVSAIYRERGENWAYMALEAGYLSVIAVPLLLQEQVIGAIMLYRDKPHHMSRRETFLLSTAAIQAAMAIQNALLFAEVKEKNAALERVNHLKSQFLATVTHELRTPLHSIISYGSLLVDGYVEGDLTAEQREHIQFMIRRAEDLSRLVDDMLDLSKIEADRLEVKVEPLSLEQTLTDVVNELKQIASNKGLYLTLEVDDPLPVVLADSHRTRQVLINMVSNALKFTEKGGITIRCMLLERYDMLRISVHDTGIGISPAALDYIFEAFRQADGSTTRRFGGTGLGLTIARKLIELQGGEVTVESIVGQGSTFSFTLPVVSSSNKLRATA